MVVLPVVTTSSSQFSISPTTLRYSYLTMPGRNSTAVATMDGLELPSSIVLVNLHVYMGIYPECCCSVMGDG